MLTLLAAVVLAQPAPASTWVVLAKKSGLPLPAALADVAVVRQALERAAVVTSPAAADLSKCQKKLPCLLKAARKEQVRYLVLVDTARVLEQAVVKVELLSVDEDGKKVDGFLVDAPSAVAAEQLRGKTGASFVPVLSAALGLAPPAPVEPPPPPPAPPPVVVAPPPDPPAAVSSPIEPAPARASGLRVVSYVVGGVGLAAVGVGAFFGVQTLAAVQARDRLCPPAEQCDSPQAFALDDQARQQQLLGFVIGGSGAALLATSLVLFFVSAPAEPPVRAVVVPTRDGVSFTLATSW